MRVLQGDQQSRGEVGPHLLMCDEYQFTRWTGNHRQAKSSLCQAVEGFSGCCREGRARPGFFIGFEGKGSDPVVTEFVTARDCETDYL